jgi:CRP/FNR family nitrogen fixation transcriptional regulator
MHNAVHPRSTGPVVGHIPTRQPNFALLSEVPELAGAIMPYERDAEIYGEGEPSEYVYKVVSGAVRTYRMLGDGRRQVIAFYLPGDVFGLDLGDEHCASAEATVKSRVMFVRRHALLQVAQRNADLTREIYEVAANELKRAHDHTLVLIKTAHERVASFLLEMAKRMPKAEAIDLPMPRQDIADYLGLTIETISRTLTLFEDSDKIRLIASRRIVLSDRKALNELNG